MSKHNYSQYSNKNVNQNTPVNDNKNVPKAEDLKPIPEVKPEPVVTPEVVNEVTPVIRPVVVQETVETKTLPETVEGVVSGCAKLNVREKPSIDADIVCVLDVMSEIAIDVNKSNNEWFHVCTATGIEGYCMRKFVEAHL